MVLKILIWDVSSISRFLFRVIRVNSWIVLACHGKEDPRIHTKQHEEVFDLADYVDRP